MKAFESIRWLAAATVAFVATPVLAQAPPGRNLAAASLEELLNITITTATRTAEGAADAPARVQVITGAQITRRGYRSLADLLSDLPDFKVDFGGDPDYPSELTVQGARGTNMVVLLMDGIRISSPTNEPLPILANYPVHAVRQIEVVYGPSSALYGADAFSAVINLVSRDASDGAGLQVQSSVGQFGLTNYTGTFVTRVGAEGSLTIAGQVFRDQQPDLSRYYPEDFGGLVAQRTGIFQTIYGPMVPGQPVSADYDIPLSAHSLQATFKRGGLRLSLFENRSNAPTAYAYTPDNAVYNDTAFARNDLVVVGGSYSATVGPVSSTSTVTASRHELHPSSGYFNVFSNLKRSYKYAHGSMAGFDQQFQWQPASGTTLTFGGNVERFHAVPQTADLNAPVTSERAPGTLLDTDIADAFQTQRYVNVGAYGQLRHVITSRISLIAGSRVDHNTRYGSSFNPRAGVVLDPTASTTVKLLYGTAYLAPSPYQAYGHYGSFYSVDGGATYQSDYWHLPNPDLEPQRKRTFEAEVRQAVGGWLTAWGSVFRSDLSEVIRHSDPDRAGPGTYLGWPVAYIDFPVNEGHTTLYGGSFGVDVLRSWSADRRLAVRTAVSLVDGRSGHDDLAPGATEPVGGLAPVQVRAGLDLDWDRWSVAPRVAAVGRQRVLATLMTPDGLERQTLDGYTTVSVHLRRIRIVRDLGAFLTVENLFDARYRHINTRAITNPEELVGAPQNPRRITVGLDLRIR